MAKHDQLESLFAALPAIPIYELAASRATYRILAGYPMPNGSRWVEEVENGLTGSDAAALIDDLNATGGDAMYRVEEVRT